MEDGNHHDAIGTEAHRRSAESLLASYEARFVAVFSFLDQAMDALEEHRDDLKEVVAGLRDHYASSSSLRRRDFDAMIGPPLRYLEDLEGRTRRALETSRRDEEEMLATLRRVLTHGDGAEPAPWSVLRDRMEEHQRSREAELARLLRDYHVELTHLVEAFGMTLKRRPRPGVRDFKRLARTLAHRQAYERTDLATSHRDLDEIRGRIRNQWGEILAATTEQGR